MSLAGKWTVASFLAKRKAHDIERVRRERGEGKNEKTSESLQKGNPNKKEKEKGHRGPKREMTMVYSVKGTASSRSNIFRELFSRGVDNEREPWRKKSLNQMTRKEETDCQCRGCR